MSARGVAKVVKVPKEYAQRKYLDAIGMGLYDLATGEVVQPEDIATGRAISVRIYLSPKALQYWESLLLRYDNNQSKLAREALCLVSQEPEHCLCCRI